jgi:ribosomal protein S18
MASRDNGEADSWSSQKRRVLRLATAAFPSWSKINYSERFRMVQAFVAGEIATYKYDCTGVSRKEQLLTAEYKADCNARRASRNRHPRRDIPPIAWGEVSPGRSSTQNRFEGRDFPAHGPGYVTEWLPGRRRSP